MTFLIKVILVTLLVPNAAFALCYDWFDYPNLIKEHVAHADMIVYGEILSEAGASADYLKALHSFNPNLSGYEYKIKIIKKYKGSVEPQSEVFTFNFATFLKEDHLTLQQKYLILLDENAYKGFKTSGACTSIPENMASLALKYLESQSQK